MADGRKYDEVNNVLSCGDKNQTDKSKIQKRKLTPKKEDNTYYEVESIIARKVIRNQVLYLIRWRGFDEKADSWEPKENIVAQGSMDTIKYFRNKHGVTPPGTEQTQPAEQSPPESGDGSPTGTRLRCSARQSTATNSKATAAVARLSPPKAARKPNSNTTDLSPLKAQTGPPVLKDAKQTADDVTAASTNSVRPRGASRDIPQRRSRTRHLAAGKLTALRAKPASDVALSDGQSAAGSPARAAGSVARRRGARRNLRLDSLLQAVRKTPAEVPARQPVRRAAREEASTDDDEVLYSVEDTSKPKKYPHKDKVSGKFVPAKRGADDGGRKDNKKMKPDSNHVTSQRRQHARTSDTPESELSDSGVTFQVTPDRKSNRSRGLLLKDSMKKKHKDDLNPKVKLTNLPAGVYGSSPSKASSLIAACPSSQGHARDVISSDLSTGSVSRNGSSLPHTAAAVVPGSPTHSSSVNYARTLPSALYARYKRPLADPDGGEGVERRTSVRQSESSFRYKDIVVKKCVGYTQIWLFTTTRMKNALNPQVLSEIQQALHNAKFDDSRLVLLTGSGGYFCSGVDLHYLLDAADPRAAATQMCDALREFVKTLISYPLPVVTAVNGPAVGLGAALLPLTDIVYASDKATFSLPYCRLGQTPEACSSLTMTQIMGSSMASAMLIGGRKITAIQAQQVGLVSEVYLPTAMMQSVVPQVQLMAQKSAKALEATKILMRTHQRAKLEFSVNSECALLADHWACADNHRLMRAFLKAEDDVLT